MIYACVPKPTPQTNADRIRAMSDAELGSFIKRLIDINDISGLYCTSRQECIDLIDSEEGIPESWCDRRLLNWLQQPVEEGNNGKEA